MVFFCTHHTPEWLPNITTLSSDLLTLLTQVSSALTKTSLAFFDLLMKKPIHLFSRYNQHSGAAGHPVPSGAEPGGAALGRASGGREAAGPPDPRVGRVPGEDLRRMEGPGSQITNKVMWMRHAEHTFLCCLLPNDCVNLRLTVLRSLKKKK